MLGLCMVIKFTPTITLEEALSLFTDAESEARQPFVQHHTVEGKEAPLNPGMPYHVTALAHPHPNTMSHSMLFLALNWTLLAQLNSPLIKLETSLLGS